MVYSEYIFSEKKKQFICLLHLLSGMHVAFWSSEAYLCSPVLDIPCPNKLHSHFLHFLFLKKILIFVNGIIGFLLTILIQKVGISSVKSKQA